ncbi:MAG TPA: HAD-IB family hydrolase [Candidatus Thermoplasmatota archaeon]|nr:HAD-IB family hydrolase [Candidatus Thermoplasmatota archaeon]
MARAAFFDFDHTLIDADAGVVLGLSLGREGYARARAFRSKPVRAAYYTYVTGKLASVLARGAFLAGLYKARIIKRSTHVRLGYGMLKGVRQRDMDARMAAIWDERLKELFFPDMLKLLDEHRKRGDRLVIVTTALRPLIEHAKKYIGEDVDIIACEPHVEEGIWSGRVEGPLYGAEKRDAMVKYAAERAIDLTESTAYSDHWSDVAFLEAVGHAVVVNPDLRLSLFAKRRGWRILRVTPPPRSSRAQKALAEREQAS